MSDPSPILESIKQAEDAFAYVSLGEPDFESQIDQEADWKLQLTKACRYLESVRVLRADDGFNGAVVELSFCAIERTLESYLIWNTDTSIAEYHDHDVVYDHAAQQGLFTRKTASNLRDLYQNNRTNHYYGGFVPTQQKEDAMYPLAENIHRFVRDQIRKEDVCVCA